MSKSDQTKVKRPQKPTKKATITKAIHDWLSRNGRLGGLATNAKRAKLSHA